MDKKRNEHRVNDFTREIIEKLLELQGVKSCEKSDNVELMYKAILKLKTTLMIFEPKTMNIQSNEEQLKSLRDMKDIIYRFM